MKMRALLATLLVVAACTSDDSPFTPDETDAVDTEVRGDTFVRNPGDSDGGDGDSDTGFLGDSDTALGAPDTAACKLGFLEDCDGRCFPDHFVGDGFCDDGTLPANFDCDLWNHDHGDCDAGDTDTDVTPADCGQLTLEFHPVAWPTEIGWHIDELSASGGGTIVRQDVAKAPYGTYQLIQTYTESLYLSPGHYQFVGEDSYGDGWHGGYFDLIDGVTGIATVSGGPEMLGTKAYFVWYFDVTCDHPKCSVDLLTTTGAHAEQSGWQLYTTADFFREEALPGTLTPGTSSRTLELYQGSYELRLRDLGGDGWEGGRIEARYHSGLLMAARGLGKGSDGVLPFSVNCGPPSRQPAFDDPGPAHELTSCTGVKLDLFQRGADFGRIGWSFWRVDDWTQVAGRLPGSYTELASFVDTVDVQSGRYYLQAVASTEAGWGDGRLAIEDPGGETLLTMFLPEGANSGRYVDFLCPTAGDTDDTDTDGPSRDCENGAVRDCEGVCFPSVFLGDRFCDDGTTWSANFACVEHDWDGGDCPGGQSTGVGDTDVPMP